MSDSNTSDDDINLEEMAEISAEEYATANNNNNTSHTQDDTDYNSSENSSSTNSSGWVNIPSGIETKRHVIDAFLTRYNKWKEYESILSTLENSSSESSSNLSLVPKYVEHLLQCEEAGMKNHMLPSMEEWADAAVIDEWPKPDGSTIDNGQDKLQSTGGLDKDGIEEKISQKLDKQIKMMTRSSNTKEWNEAANLIKEESEELTIVEQAAEKEQLEKRIHELRAKFLNVSEKELDDLDAKRKQDRLQEALFQPGMKFRGRIVVPGLGEEQEDEDEVGRSYELVIVDPEDGCIVASHAAYGDEQYVRIVLITEEVEEGSDDKRRLMVRYSDGETICEGYWNEEKFRLEGSVRQRLESNDGIFHTSEVTHVFTLYPCTGKFPTGRGDGKTTVANDNSSLSLCEDLLSRDTTAIAAHRNRTNNTLRYSLQEFIVSVQVQPRMSTIDMYDLLAVVSDLRHHFDAYIESQLNEIQQIYWKFRGVKFNELLTHTTKVAGETLCSKFRSRAALLDSYHFETVQDRDDFIAEWKEKQMDLQSAHENWDSVRFLMKSIAQMMFLFEPGSLNNTSPIHRRLEVSYECLESAYRRAEKRLTKEELTKYEIDTDRQHQGLDNVDCIICQMPLLDEGEEDRSRLYKLPCSHYFHKKCVEQWLHNNSTCPACRLDLTSMSNQVEQRINSRQRDLQTLVLTIQADREAFDEERYLRGGYE